MVTTKQQFIGWIRAMRIQFLFAYIILGIGGLVIGYIQFHIPIESVQATLSFVIIFISVIGINFRDEAADWLDGYDKIYGGAGVIREGLLTPKSLQITGRLLNLIGFLLAVLQTWFKPQLIWLLVPIFLVVLGPNLLTEKITLGHELFPAFSFIASLLWTFLGQGWVLTAPTIWFSVFGFVMVFALVPYQDIGDYEADKKSGKKTLTVRLGIDGVGQLMIGVALISFVFLYITLITL